MKRLTLYVQNGSLAGKSFQLNKEQFSIGRSQDSDLRFATDERVVSSKHALIEVRPDGFYLIDKDSTNGTYVNGIRIKEHKISDGDLISFGKNGVSVLAKIESIPDNIPLPEPPLQQENWKKSLTNIGLSGSLNTVEKKPSQQKKFIFVGLAIFAIVFLSLIVTGILVLNLGILPAIIAAVVAFTPACLYILPLIWLDRYDPEPLWLIALSFAWGALVAVIFSLIVNTTIGLLLGDIVATVISAPVFEEASKGIALVILLIFFRREFDDILDGIVYAGFIALGFATVENVLYYGRALIQGGFQGLITLFFLRGILSPFAHVTFTAMTGIGCGIARESHNLLVRITMPIVGYILAVFLHMLWNGSAVFLGPGFLLVYLIIEIPFFLIFVGFCIFVMRRQNKILRDTLAFDMARGVITKEQYEIVTSALKSTFWLLSGITKGKLKARWQFLRAAAKLGLSYWHIQRATAAQGYTGSFQQNPKLRDEVLRLRESV
jgi:RsiW-degrading membrane proteinase PrsW (M82 family)